MAGMNGASFEMGRLFGEMLQLQRQTINILDRQTEVLEDIRDEQRRSTTSAGQTSKSTQHEPGTTLQDLTQLVKALYPVILLLAAVAKKAVFPDAEPMLHGLVNLMSAIVSGGAS